MSILLLLLLMMMMMMLVMLVMLQCYLAVLGEEQEEAFALEKEIAMGRAKMKMMAIELLRVVVTHMLQHCFDYVLEVVKEKRARKNQGKKMRLKKKRKKNVMVKLLAIDLYVPCFLLLLLQLLLKKKLLTLMLMLMLLLLLVIVQEMLLAVVPFAAA